MMKYQMIVWIQLFESEFLSVPKTVKENICVKKNYCTFHRSGRRGFAFNRPDGKSTEYLGDYVG